MQLIGRWENPAFAGYHWLWLALDFLYPPTCGGCDKPGERWCASCQDGLERLQVICPVCGGPQADGKICTDCQQNPTPYRQLRSYAVYQGPLRAAILRLKYGKDIGIGEALARHMIGLYDELGWHVDLVTAVPLGYKRLRERGYNQAGMLARPLALYIKKPYLPLLLERTRETTSQVGLNAQERRKNVQGAFRAVTRLAMGKGVLVIDDVTTTGATIHACAQALLTAGASVVYGMTLARAVRRFDGTDPQDATI